MSNKKCYFNEKTKLFEIIDDTPVEKREGRLKDWLSIIISAVALIVSVIAVIISNQQKDLDITQADIANSQLMLNTRQFDSEKNPKFTIRVETQDLYSEAEYRAEYMHWLYNKNKAITLEHP